MSSAVADRAKILGTLETLVIGAAGGLLFLWLNLPGGLISGAMVTVGIAALAGRPMTLPPVLTQTVLVLLGITLGSLVSRQLIQHVSAYPLTIGLLALATFFSTLAPVSICSASTAGTRPRRCSPAAPARCRKSPCSLPRRAPMSRRSPWCRPCA